MLLIYTPKITNRLGYTIKIVFNTILHIDYTITTDPSLFIRHNGPKLQYSGQKTCDSPYIKSCELLFQTIIDKQDTNYFIYNSLPALFPVYGRTSDLPFDIFASIFYIISRYEEYLPHREDKHGRFIAEDSIAYQHGFLHLSIVDRWCNLIGETISKYYPDFIINNRKYRFVQTIDIDAAYCYLHKGFFRTITGLFRDIFNHHDLNEAKYRIRTILKKEKDPYDTFDYILDLKNKHKNSHLIFFTLLADYGIYDKAISYHNNEFRTLLQHLGDHAKMGIHPSYLAIDEPDKVGIETKRLSVILHRAIVRNRFHFLRFRLPNSYNNLTKNNILHDYSMGYAEMPGFRAGTSTPYPFYDIENDQETSLTIHPFILMDTTLKKHMSLSPKEAVKTIRTFIDECREIGTDFNCIWHNQNLCEKFGWENWRYVYEDMLDYATGQDSTSIKKLK